MTMTTSRVRTRSAMRWLLAALATSSLCAHVYAAGPASTHVGQPASPSDASSAYPAPSSSANPAGQSTNTGAAVTPLPQVMVTGAKAIDPHWQSIELRRHGAVGKNVAVTFGLPFPPGMLRDAAQVHIVDEHGNALPAHVEPTLNWHFKDGSIRAVRVQLHTELDGDSRTLRFTLGPPDSTGKADGWPYVDGLVVNTDGVRVPGVLALLNPEWMSASLIAGPQQPAASPGPYDHYFATQFKWAEPLPRTEGPSWLFDRTSTLFQQYVRTGREEYLAAASESYRYYMEHLRRVGAPGWPLCGGGWSVGEVNVCDPKYVYVEPILLALGLTGDDSEHDDALIQRMIGSWDTGGWNYPAGPYSKPEQRFTEREAGLGLLATVSAYEITGDKSYLKRIDNRLGWLYQHQQHNPDGLGNDGSWRNSWQMHEGDTYDPATDVRGSSPWMTENIIDGLWHAWLVTADPRIPTMITGFGRYLEHYGWIDLKTITDKEKDWRNPCSGPNGQITWYWSSAHASNKQLIDIENSEGWYSDAHDVEMTLPVAAARYFETDPAQQHALDQRLSWLTGSYSLDCADNAKTPRRFNWNNHGVGVVQWFMQQSAHGEH